MVFLDGKFALQNQILGEMKVKKICPFCGSELLVEKEEIEPLTEEDKEKIAIRDSAILSKLKKKTTNFWGKRKPKYLPYIIRELTPPEVVGKIKCFCGEYFLFTRKIEK